MSRADYLKAFLTVRDAYLELVHTGKLLLNPALGPDMEQRYGDELQGAYAMSRVTADDLSRMTTPSRPQSEREAIDKMSADEFYSSDYGRSLREERNRQADNEILRRQLHESEAAVGFFLAANRDYVRCDANKRLMLSWIAKHANGAMTASTLQQAYDDLEDRLELSYENNAEFGSARVVNFADLGETNPMHHRPERQHVELVEQKSVKKITWADIQKMSPEQYAAALSDTDIAPQIEALLTES